VACLACSNDDDTTAITITIIILIIYDAIHRIDCPISANNLIIHSHRSCSDANEVARARYRHVHDGPPAHATNIADLSALMKVIDPYMMLATFVRSLAIRYTNPKAAFSIYHNVP